jgi:hypothetical protein
MDILKEVVEFIKDYGKSYIPGSVMKRQKEREGSKEGCSSCFECF